MMLSNTLFYHSATKDSDFEQKKEHFKFKKSTSFVVDDKGVPHEVEKKLHGEGKYGTVRKVLSKNMIVKEMHPGSKRVKKLIQEELKMGGLVFEYCLFQVAEKDSIIRMGLPFFPGVSLFEFTQQALSFNQICAAFILCGNAVLKFQGSKLKETDPFNVHGDVSCNNLLVESTTGGTPLRVHVVDVGLARKENEITAGVWRKNSYLAPQLKYFTKAEVSQDVFSLGALIWPLSVRTYSMFDERGFSSFLVKNVQFIKNQMTYYDPSLRIDIPEATQFFYQLAKHESLLNALNRKDEESIETIFKTSTVNIDELIPFAVHAEFNKATLLLLKKYSGDADFDEKVKSTRREITERNVLYVSQWLLYYTKEDDPETLKVFCARFNKAIIKKALESYKIKDRLLIEETMLRNVECFMFLLSTFQPNLPETALIKAFLKVQYLKEEKQPVSSSIVELDRYLTYDKTKAIVRRICPELKISDDLKSHLDSFNKDGETLAHLAARAGDLTTLKKLIELKPELLFIENLSGRTPLHLAAKKHVSILESFSASPAMHCVDHYHETVAHIAARYNEVTVLKFLLSDHSALLSASKITGETVAHLAAKEGNCDILKILPKDILTIPEEAGLTPFHIAIKYGKVEVVRFFLEEKVDLFAREYLWGLHALHLAAGYGQVESAKLLMAADASLINTESLRGTKPIESAIECGKMNTFELLLEGTSDKDSLVHAIVNGVCPEMLGMLKQYTVDFNYPDSEKLTPLQKAAQLGNEGMVKALLEQKVDPNYSHNTQSAFDYAVKKPHFKIMNLLLEADANVDAYLQSTQITPIFAFIMLKKLKMHMTHMQAGDDTIPLHVRNKLNCIDLQNESTNWIKHLEDIMRLQPSVNNGLGLFSLPQLPQVNFASIEGLKEFLMKKPGQLLSLK